MSHTARLPYAKLAPKAFNSLLNLSGNVRKDLLGKRLVEMVFMRVSQINGCAFCVDMHWKDLVEQGVPAREINAIAAWREAPFFSPRERVALHWAELVTAIPNSDTSDEEFKTLQSHFKDEEIAELGFAIATITAWNLLNVSFRNPLPA